MPIAMHRVHSVWRPAWTHHAKINGVCREIDEYQYQNGIWRCGHDHMIDTETLIGFRIVYTYDPLATYEDFPWIHSRKDLPVTMRLTGDNRGHMDMTTKGVVFEYDREMPYTEGICMYRGILYAEFPDDMLIPINSKKGSELWTTFNFADMDIRIIGYEAYESYGYYVSGWNSIFHKEQFLDPTVFPDKDPHRTLNRLEKHTILPIEVREDDYDSGISIGIARNLTTPDRNMVGSHGVLDHTYKAIYANGEAKPFVVELYH